MTVNWADDPFGVGVAMERWRRDQQNRRFALAIRNLLRTNRVKSPGYCPQRVIDVIEDDDALTAYFRSVALAGEDAWTEEVQRVRRRQAYRRRMRDRVTDRKTEATTELSVVAIGDLLETWRGWGRMLIEAGQAPGFLDPVTPPTADGRDGPPPSNGRC